MQTMHGGDKMKFIKMQGCGNDFVIVDEREQQSHWDSARAIAVSERKYGIGCDQILVVRPNLDPQNLAVMIFNADGTPAGACGNGFRCLGQHFMQSMGTNELRISVGERQFTCNMSGNGTTVNLGKVKLAEDAQVQAIVTEFGASFLHCCRADIGNQHILTLVSPDAFEKIDVCALHARLKKQGADACLSIVCPQDGGAIAIKTMERGASSQTLSCGTGACCAAYATNALQGGALPAAFVLRFASNISMPVTIDASGNCWLGGEVQLVFVGETTL